MRSRKLLFTQLYLLHGPLPQHCTPSATRPKQRTKADKLHSADWGLSVVILPPPQGNGPDSFCSNTRVNQDQSLPPGKWCCFLRIYTAWAWMRIPSLQRAPTLHLLAERPSKCLEHGSSKWKLLTVINRQNRQLAAWQHFFLDETRENHSVCFSTPCASPCYRQRPCCWPLSRAQVPTHLVAQEQGTSLSNPDSTKASRDALVPGARAKQLTMCLAGARCSHAPCAEGVNARSIPAPCLSLVLAHGLWLPLVRGFLTVAQPGWWMWLLCPGMPIILLA